VRTMVQRGNGRGDAPHIVVLLDGAAALRAIPGMSTVLQRGPTAGISVLALDSVATALPSETGALLDLTDPNRPSLRLSGHEHQQFVGDAVGAWWADRLSRGLAPLRDATPSGHGALPSTVPLLSLVPGADDAQVVAALWQEPPRAAAPIGVTAQGPWVLDLAADGPHVLVAGTTGSGKSELLRTLVVSLSIHHRPEDLSFVLVDYKGGAAFRECERLPHTAGVVTDLDEHLAQRALTSLRAELKRRERLFVSVGATDFASYQRHSAPEQALPRLVVVIDEFRALAEELPEFVDGIVSIAALGRSLGLHVVLATQRPAGVVTADIKANVNLRIALRVRDSTDSQDVLDSPEAATIDPAVPGRGYARSGGSGLVGFHAAHFSAVGQPTGIRVRDLAWGRTQPPWPTPEGSRDEASERIITAVAQAAAMVGAAPSPPVWLPPLPHHVPLASLPSPPRPECCAIGLVDRPELHSQAPLELDLDTPGHWSFVGAGSSGRTTALETVARALASRLGADRLHVYAVSGGSLVGLTDLPQCGAHVDVTDLGRLERLVDRLEAEVRSRQRNVGPERARLLLLVDDWDVVAGEAGSLDHAMVLGRLLGLLRQGEAHGLTAVVAGDRSLLLGRVASVISRRVLLRLADRGDAALAGLAVTAVPADPPPGRGVLRDGTEVQLAVGPAGPARRAAVGPSIGPPRLDPLPTRVVARDLPAPDLGAGLLVGLGGDAVEPLALREESDGRRWLVAGARGSGVSNALLLVAQGLVDAGRPVTVVAPRPGPLDALRHDRRLLGWRDARSLTAGDLPRECPGLAVVADGADELLDTRAEDLLRDFSRQVERQGGLLVVGASATTLMTQYRGVGTEVARERTGILLGPRSALEGDLFGLRLRADPQAPPGRGYLIRRGRALPLQVALTGTPSEGG
jgi:S-DNA-T family DNA segregation ATPase FtsK/SpoIIIE